MAGSRALWLVPLLVSAQPQTTKLVTFDVAAIDARGNPVSDLRADDFRVKDAGNRQEIVYFRRAQDVDPPAGALARARSNHSYGTFPHATVVVVDQLNSRLELIGTEWDEVTRALGRAERERDAYLYILMKNGSLYPVHGLPDSWVESAGRSRYWAREVLPLFDDMRGRFIGRPEDLDLARTRFGSAEYNDVLKRRQQFTETAIQELTTRLATVPGPKSIAWIGFKVKDQGSIQQSNGEPIDPVPIYSVAPEKTGNPRIEETIARAMADPQCSYRIGYYPPAANWDGRRHDVRITSTRRGVQVRARDSYTAVRAVDVEDDQRQRVPDLAAVSPFDASTIRFSVTASEIRVNADDILFHRSGDECSCSLAVQVNDSHGPLLVDRKLNCEAARRDGVRIPVESAGGGQLRIVVLDRATQSFGTLTINR